MRASGQFSFALLSQAASAASNFLLTIAVVQTARPSQIAPVVLAQVVYGFGISAIRSGLYRKTLVSCNEEDSRALVAPALLLGCVMAFAYASLAIVTQSWQVAWFALAMPGLALLEALRQVFLVSRRVKTMAALDLTWLLFFGAVVASPMRDHPTSLVAGWSSSGLLVALIYGRYSRIKGDLKWTRTIDDLARNRSPIGEVIILRGIPLLALLLVSIVVEFEQFGSWTALNSLFGPLNLTFAALSAVGLTFLASSRFYNDSRTLLMAMVTFAGIPFVSLAWGYVIVVAYLDRTWGPSADVAIGLRPFAVPVALYIAASGILLLMRTFTHAKGIEDRRSLQAQATSSVVLGLSLVLGSPFGMATTSWTGVLGSFMAVGIWTREWLSLSYSDHASS